MPGASVFVDSNILIYAHDAMARGKETAAKAWLRALAIRGAGLVNLQVLNEVAAVLLRKKWFATPDEVFTVVDLYSTFGDSSISRIEVGRARSLHRSLAYSWWDCLLLASALELGCTHYLSEDLQDGQVIEGLTIVDPFAHTPEQILSPR